MRQENCGLQIYKLLGHHSTHFSKVRDILPPKINRHDHLLQAFAIPQSYPHDAQTTSRPRITTYTMHVYPDYTNPHCASALIYLTLVYINRYKCRFSAFIGPCFRIFKHFSKAMYIFSLYVGRIGPKRILAATLTVDSWFPTTCHTHVQICNSRWKHSIWL